MRLSAAEQLFGDTPLPDTLARVRDAGFDGVDLRMSTLEDPLTEAVLSRAGLPVGAIYSQVRDPGLLSAGAAERAAAVDRVVACAERADAAGASNLIVVPVFGAARLAGVRPVIEEAELETAVLLAGLLEVAERVAGLSVTVTLEPLNRAETHFLVDPARGRELCDAIGSPRIATMVDTYHCACEGQDIPAKLAAAGDRLALVHLSDTDRQLPGEGAVDFRAVVGAVESLGYDGWLGYECRVVQDLDDLRRSVELLRSFETDGKEATA